ncbi:hypothetical protein GCM10020256_22790 [Streptomyces thermocoprophilus]
MRDLPRPREPPRRPGQVLPGPADRSGVPFGAFLGQMRYVSAISPWMATIRPASAWKPRSDDTSPSPPTYQTAPWSRAHATAAASSVRSHSAPSYRARAMP